MKNIRERVGKLEEDLYSGVDDEDPALERQKREELKRLEAEHQIATGDSALFGIPIGEVKRKPPRRKELLT